VSQSWNDVGCASIAMADLPALAELRRWPGVYVSIDGDRAWIHWEPEPEMARAALRYILPLPGVELFTQRGGRWYRLGQHLPAFEVPALASSGRIPLERILLPRPITAQRPGDVRWEPIPVRLVRDEGGQPGPASALRCQLGALLTWAEHATSAELSRLHGTWIEAPEGSPGSAEVLLLGTPGQLPLLAGATRLRGTEVLVPVGQRIDPDLPEPALRGALGAAPEELVLFEGAGFELIPRAVFMPLSRGGIRLAWQATHPHPQPGRSEGDRRS
jgi:hypothetical protein